MFNPNVKKKSKKKNTVAQTERRDIIQLEALDKVQEEEEEEGETREMRVEMKGGKESH